MRIEARRHIVVTALALLFVAGSVGALAAVLAPVAVAHDLSANGGCRDGETLVFIPAGSEYPDRNGDLTVCRTARGSYHDNHVHNDGGGGGWRADGCREGDTLAGVAPGHEADTNGDLAVCRTPTGEYYDNRVPKDGGTGGGGWTADGCREGDTLAGVAPGHEADTNGDLAVCRTPTGEYYDNRVPKDGGTGGGGWTADGCREGDTLAGVAPGHEADTNGDLAVCRTPTGEYYDNRVS